MGEKKEKTLSFRVEAERYEKYRAGEKYIEYRTKSDYWTKRFEGAKKAVITCGKRAMLEFDVVDQGETESPWMLMYEGLIETERCFYAVLKNMKIRPLRPKDRKIGEF